MFCVKCGNQIEDGSKFCPYCGSVIEGPKQSVKPQPIQAQQVNSNQGMISGSEQQKNGMAFQQTSPAVSKMKNYDWKKIGIIAGIVAAVIFVCIIAASIIKGRNTTLKLDQYVSFECEGYDGYGTATATFNSEKFIADYRGKIKYSKEGKKFLKALYGDHAKDIMESVDPAEDIAGLFGGKLNKTEELSNGETIVYKWDFDDDEILKYYKVKLDYSDVKYEVSGLDVIGTFDAFDGVEVEFSGTSPCGSASVTSSKKEGVYGSLNYSIENNENLKNGDEITVKVTYGYRSNEEEMAGMIAEEYGKIPEAWEKKYTVEGLPYYIDKISDIPSDTMSAMQKQMTDFMDNKVATNWDPEDEKFKSMDYLGAYLLTPKVEGRSNYLYLVYKVSGWNDDYGDFEYYTFIRFEDLKIVDGGLCEVDLNDYDTASNWIDFGSLWNYYYGYKNLDEVFSDCVTSNVEEYTYESTVEDSVTSTPTEATEEESDDSGEEE